MFLNLKDSKRVGEQHMLNSIISIFVLYFAGCFIYHALTLERHPEIDYVQYTLLLIVNSCISFLFFLFWFFLAFLLVWLLAVSIVAIVYIVEMVSALFKGIVEVVGALFKGEDDA